MNSSSAKPFGSSAAFHIGSPFGIPVRIHWTFLSLIGLVWVFSGLDLGVIRLLACVFISVLFHEFGHALMAKRLGVRVREIAFWSLGGMTRMEIPEDPRLEGWIAFAGPAVNFVLAALSGLLSLALAPAGPEPLLARMLSHPIGVFAGVNLMLGIFNLVPAFPMDGGRILRSYFARTRSWLAATESAVRIGRIVAVGVLLLALLTGGRENFLCMLPIIALFLYIAGGRELMSVRLRATGSPFGPGSGFRVFVPRADGFGEAGARDAEWSESETPGTQILPPAEGSGSRFTDDEIERLERQRGRLDEDETP